MPAALWDVLEYRGHSQRLRVLCLEVPIAQAYDLSRGYRESL